MPDVWRAGVLAVCCAAALPGSRPVLELERVAAADPWLGERLRVLPVGGRLFLD